MKGLEHTRGEAAVLAQPVPDPTGTPAATAFSSKVDARGLFLFTCGTFGPSPSIDFAAAVAVGPPDIAVSFIQVPETRERPTEPDRFCCREAWGAEWCRVLCLRLSAPDDRNAGSCANTATRLAAHAKSQTHGDSANARRESSQR